MARWSAVRLPHSHGFRFVTGCRGDACVSSRFAFQQLYEEGASTVPKSQTRKARHREVGDLPKVTQWTWMCT